MNDLYEHEMLSTPTEEPVFLDAQQQLEIKNNDEKNELNTQISEFSKKGYQLLKENDIKGAKEAYNQI